MLLIIDNRSLFIRTFERKLKQRNIVYKFYYHHEQIDLNERDKIKGVILSGGAGSPYQPLNLTADFVALMNLHVPTIGFCLGHEIIAVAHGGIIDTLPEYQNKREHIIVNQPEDIIFENVDIQKIRLREQHQFHIPNTPEDFILLAHSQACPVEIMRHKTKPIYSFQSHPEVSGKTGDQMMHNFLKLCDIDY